MPALPGEQQQIGGTEIFDRGQKLRIGRRDGTEADGGKGQVEADADAHAQPGQCAGARAAPQPAGGGEHHVLPRRQVEKQAAADEGQKAGLRDIGDGVPDHARPPSRAVFA